MSLPNFTERAVPGVTANFLMEEATTRYKFALKYLKKGNICDMACGTGYGTNILSSKGKVIGIDISEEALSFALTNYASTDVSFVKSDVYQTIFKDGSFTGITAFEMIEHLRKPKVFLNEVRRLLKEEGVFVVSTPNKLTQSPHGIPMSPYHDKEYSPDELNKLLKQYFKSVTLVGQTKSKFAKEAYSDFLNSQKARQLFVDLDILGFRKLFSKSFKEKIWKKLGGPFGRSSQEKVSSPDFIFSKRNINSCEYILAICQK